jgi:hypothetical protein
MKGIDMAAAFYDLFLRRLLDNNYDGNGAIDMNTDDIRAQILTSGYTRNLTTHDFLNDLVIASNSPASGATATLTTEAVDADASFDSDDPTWTSVTTGSTITQITLYKNTGTDTTSPLVANYDGFSQATNGGNLNGTVNASGWFDLA